MYSYKTITKCTNKQMFCSKFFHTHIKTNWGSKQFDWPLSGIRMDRIIFQIYRLTVFFFLDHCYICYMYLNTVFQPDVPILRCNVSLSECLLKFIPYFSYPGNKLKRTHPWFIINDMIKMRATSCLKWELYGLTFISEFTGQKILLITHFTKWSRWGTKNIVL